MGSDALLKLVKVLLNKEIIKQLLAPFIDEVFDNIAKLAKSTESTLDDATVEALRKAAKEVLAKW